MILDSKKKKEIWLGRDFTTELLGKWHAFVLGSTLTYSDLNSNHQDVIRIGVDLRDYFEVLYGTSSPLIVDDIHVLAQLIEGGNVRDDEALEISPSSFFNITEIDGRNLKIWMFQNYKQFEEF